MSLELIFILLLFVPLAISVLFGDFICGLIAELAGSLAGKIRTGMKRLQKTETTLEPVVWEREEWERILENPEAF